MLLVNTHLNIMLKNLQKYTGFFCENAFQPEKIKNPINLFKERRHSLCKMIVF